MNRTAWLAFHDGVRGAQKQAVTRQCGLVVAVCGAGYSQEESDAMRISAVREDEDSLDSFRHSTWQQTYRSNAWSQ